MRTKKERPTSVKTRIADHLGIKKPPVGQTIPTKKGKPERGVNWQRNDFGAVGLSILGDRDTLDPVL